MHTDPTKNISDISKYITKILIWGILAKEIESGL